MGTDPHIQTLLASLTALHPKLVTDIEDTERKMKTQKLLLEKIGTCQQARESLNKMREEHLEKVGAPHHTTPHHTIPHHTTAHHTTPYHTNCIRSCTTTLLGTLRS